MIYASEERKTKVPFALLVKINREMKEKKLRADATHMSISRRTRH